MKNHGSQWTKQSTAIQLSVNSVNMEENDSTSDLWLLSTDGKVQRQLTSHPAKDGGPVWSPDGKHIAFVSKRDGDVAQIHLISPEGGEARQLTKLPMEPSAFRWAPDSKTIYCIVHTWHNTPDDDSYKKKEKEHKDAKVKAYIIDDALFRVWDHWIADGKRPVLFAVDANDGKHRNLFTGTKLHLPINEPSASSYAISPDGKQVCFTADSIKDIGTDFNSDLYVMPLHETEPPRNLTADNPAGDFDPVYSPDGKSIAFIPQTTKYFYADRARLMVHDLGAGKNRELTAQFDRSCGNQRWTPDSTRLYFAAEDKGCTRLFTVSIKGDDVTPLTSGFSDRQFDVSMDCKTLAFIRSSFGLPPAVYAVTDSGYESPRRIEHFNDAISARWDLGDVKEVYFKGADNHDVQMWIVFPPGFDSGQKWPLLQVVHGGPHNGITSDYHFRWNLHLMASKGYIVSQLACSHERDAANGTQTKICGTGRYLGCPAVFLYETFFVPDHGAVR